MPLLGSAAMLLAFDVDAGAIDEHDRWHTHEHLPERMSIPGFHRGTRWTAVAGAPRYMVLYEVASLATLASDAYLERLNNPTPWTSRIMPHYRAMSRGLCSVLGSFGYGQGGEAALIRFSPEKSRAAELQRWLLEQALPGVPGTTGLGSAHLLQAAQTAAMTAEQRIRGADRGVDSALVITGYDSGAVAAFAQEMVGPGSHLNHAVSGLNYGLYRLSYSLSSAEIDA
ncbi:hypothetical protein SUTH_01368 [Sulfuritalea hydrogenivorans sk43H]|uniref:Uncharacterized protein n=2 Tax=Sulfuritalea hydrogenivorans TaxID=748811 RepID=W0SHB7_9PROT|nr:hypothetical protein SUTH_01368 [Sulfuritalea hydrogenivorans sk43H]